MVASFPDLSLYKCSTMLARTVLLRTSVHPSLALVVNAASVSSLSSSAVSCRDQHRQYHSRQVSLHREFHATAQREILPLMGLAATTVIIRYSYKAIKRMQEEQEEYLWELQQYEKRKVRSGGSDDTDTTSSTTIRTVLAVDLGSVYTKLALSSPPKVILSREGDRSVFNGVVYDEDNKIPQQRGRAALERYTMMIDTDNNNDSVSSIVSMPWYHLNFTTTPNDPPVVQDSLKPLVTEALEQVVALDTDQSSLIRFVATCPVAQLRSTHVYAHALSFLAEKTSSSSSSSPSSSLVIVPEPVATIWGAQRLKLLPLPDNTTSNNNKDDPSQTHTTTLVLDVGGLVTQLAVVENDILLDAVTIPWGGETLVRITVEYLLQQSPVPLKDVRSLAALQVQARAAVTELTAQKTRVAIHVPYLFPDPKQHHLDTELSRAVLEQAVQVDLQQEIANLLDTKLFSPHLPQPHDLTSLWLSTMTQVLERSKVMPHQIDHVLLVGGGSKPRFVVQSVQSALTTLMGDANTRGKLIVPDESITELTVLGATTMLPSFDYHVEYGLCRI